MRARIFTIWLLAYIIGSMVAPLFEMAPELYLILGLILTAGSILVFGKRYLFAIMLGIGVFLVAISAFQYKEAELVRKNEVLAQQKVQIIGYVSDVPTTNEFGQTVEIIIKTVNDTREKGSLKLYAPAYPKHEYAEILQFEAQVKLYDDKKWRLVKDGFVGTANLNDYEIVGTERGIGVTVKGWLFAIRSRFNDTISRSLPASESGLASGLILGEKALITPEVTRQLQISGTTHIIALSGYNITIILGLFVFFEKKWNRITRLLVPIGFILAFVAMTGGAPSLIRAAIMGFMPLLAVYLGREADSFIAILFSAVIMVAFNPFLALFDVGFQLSFTALAGMIYLAPIIARLLSKLPEYIVGPLSETTGAQLAAMPLLAYYFGSVSLVSPFANLLILALVPYGMLVSFVVGLAGMIWQTLGNLVAIPSYVLLHLINQLISFFGSIPAASKTIKMENPIWILLMYFVLFDLWLVFSKVGRTRPTE